MTTNCLLSLISRTSWWKRAPKGESLDHSVIRRYLDRNHNRFRLGNSYNDASFILHELNCNECVSILKESNIQDITLFQTCKKIKDQDRREGQNRIIIKTRVKNDTPEIIYKFFKTNNPSSFFKKIICEGKSLCFSYRSRAVTNKQDKERLEKVKNRIDQLLVISSYRRVTNQELKELLNLITGKVVPTTTQSLQPLNQTQLLPRLPHQNQPPLTFFKQTQSLSQLPNQNQLPLPFLNQTQSLSQLPNQNQPPLPFSEQTQLLSRLPHQNQPPLPFFNQTQSLSQLPNQNQPPLPFSEQTQSLSQLPNQRQPQPQPQFPYSGYNRLAERSGHSDQTFLEQTMQNYPNLSLIAQLPPCKLRELNYNINNNLAIIEISNQGSDKGSITETRPTKRRRSS